MYHMATVFFSQYSQWFTPDSILEAYGDSIDGRKLQVQNAIVAQWKVTISERKKMTLKEYMGKYISNPHAVEVQNFRFVCLFV